MDIAPQTLNTPTQDHHDPRRARPSRLHPEHVLQGIPSPLRCSSSTPLSANSRPDLTAGARRAREHLLVRSLGISQVIVAVNKLDQVECAKLRYDEIVELFKPFLAQSGFLLWRWVVSTSPGRSAGRSAW